MKLGWTLIYVADVAATVAFYESAFKLRRRFVHESGLFAEMETGETTLSFAANGMAELNGLRIRPNAPGDVAAGFELCLVSDDPDGAFAHAVAAGRDAGKGGYGEALGPARRLCARPERMLGGTLFARRRRVKTCPAGRCQHCCHQGDGEGCKGVPHASDLPTVKWPLGTVRP